jgi:hypothetical protein
MANTQHIKTEKESASKVDTSDDLIKSQSKADMPLGELKPLSKSTIATTQNASQKTLTSADLQELQSRIGLVAGALADFQTAGGLVVLKNEEATLPSGSPIYGMKIYLMVRGAKITKTQTADGLDLSLVAQE